MKEVKAFVHTSRIGDVIAGLKATAAWTTGQRRNLTAHLVQGLVVANDDRARHYSVELGDEVINEYMLEVLVADEDIDEVIAVIRSCATVPRRPAGWIYVVDVAQAMPIA